VSVVTLTGASAFFRLHRFPGCGGSLRVRSPPSPTGGERMSDWTTDAVDNIEKVVGAVRDKTVKPAQGVTRAIVFGLLTTFFIATAVALFSIGVFRVVDVYLPTGVWATYLIFGGIFVLAGSFCWTRRTKSSSSD
jgi:hypothetical protein